jgi:hypothetical protein
MDQRQQEILLEKAAQWFSTVIMENHKANTAKLSNPNEFDINPFLVTYLAAFHSGRLDPKTVASAMVLPRVLGTSITTSFGTNIQKFTTEVLKEVFGSTTDGIDIEFNDAVSGKKTYAQVKLGPNTINKDDVQTIHGHFTKALRLAKTNNSKMGESALVVGVLYGEVQNLSGHYKALRDDHRYPVLVGANFWHHLTGNPDFYKQLIDTIAQVAVKANGKQLIEETITALAATPELQKYQS